MGGMLDAAFGGAVIFGILGGAAGTAGWARATAVRHKWPAPTAAALGGFVIGFVVLFLVMSFVVGPIINVLIGPHH